MDDPGGQKKPVPCFFFLLLLVPPEDALAVVGALLGLSGRGIIGLFSTVFV